MSSKHKKRAKKFSYKRFLKIFLTYFVLFIALSGMIDYYAYMEFNFLYFILLSAFIALPIAYVHVKRGKRDHVDEVANEIF